MWEDHSERGCGFETCLSLLCGRQKKVFQISEVQISA
jgi:hypothetical protein